MSVILFNTEVGFNYWRKFLQKWTILTRPRSKTDVVRPELLRKLHHTRFPVL